MFFIGAKMLMTIYSYHSYYFNNYIIVKKIYNVTKKTIIYNIQ